MRYKPAMYDGKLRKENDYMKIKKLTAMLIAAALAMSLCGCDAIQALNLPPLPTVEVSDTTPPEESVQPTLEVGEEVSVELPNMVIASISGQTRQEFAPDGSGQVILSFGYETPTVYVDGNDEATLAINDYLSILDEKFYSGHNTEEGYYDGFNNMLEAATDNYTYAMETGTDLMLEFSQFRTATIQRIDSQVISVVYNDYTYSGGAHGLYGDTAYVFDTVSGELVTLDMLSDDKDALMTTLAGCLVELAEGDEQYANILTLEDYPTALAALIREGSWYFTPKGICIFSSLYEIGSYAEGIYRFDIPYSTLEGSINDKWLPRERQGEGEISVLREADYKGDREIVDMIVSDEDGEALYMLTDGTIYDVQISQVDYTGETFYKTAMLWSGSYLNDCALQLKAIVPEGMPNLMISYTTAAGETHNMLIGENGNDGGISLVDDTITAVG